MTPFFPVALRIRGICRFAAPHTMRKTNQCYIKIGNSNILPFLSCTSFVQNFISFFFSFLRTSFSYLVFSYPGDGIDNIIHDPVTLFRFKQSRNRKIKGRNKQKMEENFPPFFVRHTRKNQVKKTLRSRLLESQ